MSFEADRELFEFVHLNVRREIHGDEKVNGIDLRFRAVRSNETLVQFSPTLKSDLYRREETPQQDIDPASVPFTILKNPPMGTIKWDDRYDCARAVVHHGIDESSDIVFGLAKVNKFAITAQQGGTYVLEYRVQVSDPDAEDIAKLSAVLGQSVYVSVDPEGGEEEDEEQADFGDGANEIAEQIAAQKDPVARRSGRKQMALVE
jgi:hypothetical protein